MPPDVGGGGMVPPQFSPVGQQQGGAMGVGGGAEIPSNKEGWKQVIAQVPIETLVGIVKKDPTEALTQIMQQLQPLISGDNPEEKDEAIAFDMANLLYEAILDYVPEATGQTLSMINPEFGNQVRRGGAGAGQQAGQPQGWQPQMGQSQGGQPQAPRPQPQMRVPDFSMRGGA